MTQSKRTGGEWFRGTEITSTVLADVGGARIRVLGNEPSAYTTKEERAANAETARIAGTTANKLDALGYDGDKCIETLPSIMRRLEEDAKGYGPGSIAQQFLASLRSPKQ